MPKDEIGILVGKIKINGTEVEGTWECAVYFRPGQLPGKPIAYLIGYASRTEDPK